MAEKRVSVVFNHNKVELKSLIILLKSRTSSNAMNWWGCPLSYHHQSGYNFYLIYQIPQSCLQISNVEIFTARLFVTHHYNVSIWSMSRHTSHNYKAHIVFIGKRVFINRWGQLHYRTLSLKLNSILIFFLILLM